MDGKDSRQPATRMTEELFFSSVKAKTKQELREWLKYNDKQYEVLSYKNGKQDRLSCSLKNVKLRRRDNKNQPVIYVSSERNS